MEALKQTNIEEYEAFDELEKIITKSNFVNSMKSSIVSF